MCLVCALPSGLDASKVRAAAFAAVQNAKIDLKYVHSCHLFSRGALTVFRVSREKALLADLEDGYALVIT